MKRLIIATLLGIIFGFVCFGLASSGGKEVSTVLAANIITGRMLIGIGIGISRFPIKHWALHGLVMGLIFSIPSGLGAMMGSQNTDFSQGGIFMATVVMGMIYGFLIELITTVFFKAGQ
jgi:hypothetical protein